MKFSLSFFSRVSLGFEGGKNVESGFQTIFKWGTLSEGEKSRGSGVRRSFKVREKGGSQELVVPDHEKNVVRFIRGS